MSNVVTPVTGKRHAWVAVVLSLLLPGLGEVYCGALARGMLLACLSALCIPVTAAMLANQVPVGAFTLVGIGVLGLAGVTIIAIVDSYRLARRTQAGYELKEYNQLLVYVLLFAMGKGGALGALLYTRDYVMEAFIVPTNSMSPTIEPGDRVLGNKMAYKTSDPRRGDVIIFRNPENWRQNNIKRVAAVAGETIEMKDGRVLIDGKDQHPPSGAGAGSFAAVTVPPHYCYVLGDNREESRDSRQYGPVPLASIIARADYLYWPAGGWSRFGRLVR